MKGRKWLRQSNQGTSRINDTYKRDEIVGGVCNFLVSLSLQQKFEMADQCYSSVLLGQAKENTPLRPEGRPTSKKKGAQFWILFLHVFPPPLSLPYVNWASQKGCLFQVRFSLQSSDLLLFHFLPAFPFFVF